MKTRYLLIAVPLALAAPFAAAQVPDALKATIAKMNECAKVAPGSAAAKACFSQMEAQRAAAAQAANAQHEAMLKAQTAALKQMQQKQPGGAQTMAKALPPAPPLQTVNDALAKLQPDERKKFDDALAHFTGQKAAPVAANPAPPKPGTQATPAAALPTPANLKNMDVQQMMLVMQQVQAQILDKNMKQQVTQVQTKNEQIGKLNELQAKLTEATNTHTDAKPNAGALAAVEQAKVNAGMTLPSLKTKADVDSQTKQVQAKIAAESTQQQAEMLKMQEMMKMNTQAMDQISAMLQKMSQTQVNLIKNMKP